MVKSLALVCALLAVTSVARAEGTSDVGTNIALLTQTSMLLEIQDDNERVSLTASGDVAFSAQLSSGSRFFPLSYPGPATEQRITPGKGVWRVHFEHPSGGQGHVYFELQVIQSDGAIAHGRIYSKEWWFDAGDYMRTADTSFYVLTGRTARSPLWRLEMNGLAGFQFSVTGSALGPRGASVSKSTPMGGYSIANDYDVFLRPPSITRVAAPSTDGLVLTVSSAGLVLDSATDGAARIVAYDGQTKIGEEALKVNAGKTVVPLALLGATGNGSYRFDATLTAGEFHFSAVDVEYCQPGIRLFGIDHGVAIATVMHWDDSLVSGNSADVAPPTGMQTGAPETAAISSVNAHGWGTTKGDPYGGGNNRFMDTWVSAEVASASVSWAFDAPPATSAAAGATDQGNAGSSANAEASAGSGQGGGESINEGHAPAPEALVFRYRGSSGCSQTGAESPAAFGIALVICFIAGLNVHVRRTLLRRRRSAASSPS